jgi:hypothetical protein
MSTVPSIDVGALSGSLYGDAARVLAETLILGFDWAEEDENPLNQRQQVELTRAMLAACANLEASFARTLINDLESAGVETWGLSSELESILARKVNNV